VKIASPFSLQGTLTTVSSDPLHTLLNMHLLSGVNSPINLPITNGNRVAEVHSGKTVSSRTIPTTDLFSSIAAESGNLLIDQQGAGTTKGSSFTQDSALSEMKDITMNTSNSPFWIDYPLTVASSTSTPSIENGPKKVT
jgi:hypothetical protein